MKRKIFIGLIILGIASITYGFVWKRAARKFEQKIVCLLEDLKNHQCDVKYDRLAIVGFPFKLMAKLKNPIFIKDKVGLSLIKVEGNIRAQASVFNFKKLSFSTHGVTHVSYQFNAPYPVLTLTTQQLEGDIDLWRTGLNRAAKITLGHVDLTLGEQQVKAEKIVVENFQIKMPTHLKTEMTASNIEHGFKLQAPFDQRIEHLGIRTRFDLEDQVDIKNLGNLLEALAHQGGIFELEHSDLQWGKLKLQGIGTLTLDAVKQPLASTSVVIQGLEQVLTQLVDLKLIKPYVPGIAMAVLSPFKVESVDASELPIYKIPLSLQDGQVSVASFPLVKIPQVDWIPALSMEKSAVTPASTPAETTK
ncbi:MAG: DUF2125 domain-containing protein [Janthinobacterium lividum]